MPTFENQKEESLTTEARRPDNRGPKGRKIEIQLGGVGEHCKLPQLGSGAKPQPIFIIYIPLFISKDKINNLTKLN